MAQLFGRPRIAQTGRLVVDPNHSLARNLHDCVIFNVGGLHGLVNLAAPGLGVTPGVTSTGALPTWGTTIDGIAGTTVSNAGGSASGKFDVANQGSIAASDCAVRVRFIYNGQAAPIASFVTLCSKSGGGNREIGIFFNSSTGVISQVNLGNGTVSSPGGNAFTVGTLQDIVLTRTGGVGAIYQNGVATVTGMSIAGTTSVATSVTLGSDNANGGNTGSISFLQFQTWTRNITAAEALQLYLDPFCFLTSVSLQETLMIAPPSPPVVPMMGQIWI